MIASGSIGRAGATADTVAAPLAAAYKPHITLGIGAASAKGLSGSLRR